MLSELIGRPSERCAQVGSAHIADEQRVAGQDRLRPHGVAIEIEHEDGNRFNRVPRRLEHRQADPAELQTGAVGHRRECILRLRAGAQVNGGAGAIAKLEVSRHEIGVEVGQKDVTDLQPDSAASAT